MCDLEIVTEMRDGQMELDGGGFAGANGFNRIEL